MNIHFEVEYHTKWGEDLRVIPSKIKKDGKKILMPEMPLNTDDGKIWSGDIAVSGKDIVGIEYLYAMYDRDELVWTEWIVAPHIVYFTDKIQEYVLSDCWRPIPDDLPLYSSAFTECVGTKPAADVLATATLYPMTLQLRVVEPRLKKGEYLGICGSSKQLGEWANPLRMEMIALQEWAINIDASLLYNEAEYKYVILNDEGKIIKWEDSLNRKLSSPQFNDKQMRIKTDSRPAFNLPNWKAAGVVIPVFSLRTKGSFGVGDFGDLKTMVGWAARTKMHVIQILPINDTITQGDYKDSYPYNAISIYAFHPLYCNLRALPQLKDKLAMEKFMMKQQELNALPKIDYVAVIRHKLDYLRKIYAQEGKETIQSAGFKEFFDANQYWLVPYASFSYLRDANGTADFSQWGKYSKYAKKQIEALTSPESDTYEAIAFYYYVQYQLHLQLLDARNTARDNGIIIKGDIPIGISRQSVEAWQDPHLFNLDGQAGAPPDDFSVNGQNWGFPTYNWDVMAKNGYQWWERRFKKMAEYFDAYRIDHVLGFFRIWEIPTHSVHGLLGQFSPSLPMSIHEIESYGLHFRQELMTRPYITEESVEKIFGYKKELISLLYLDKRTDGRYDLKPEFASQRLIQKAFEGKTGEDDIQVRDGLYQLASCVLFVPDHNLPEFYHPRISAQNDFIYQSLPAHEKAAFDNLYNEYFYRRHNLFWYKEAMKKLPALTQSTRMLVCAEDLGMVPDCVPWVMNQLRILSLEIQTMPKQMGLEFGRLENNPYRSVTTIFTHDMPTLRMWWDEDMQRTQNFYNHVLYNDGKAPHPAPAWLCNDIVARHLFSPSILCLISWQDWMSIDEKMRLADSTAERINIPSNPRHYWQYRMHLNIEDLMKADELNDNISALICNSGRD